MTHWKNDFGEKFTTQEEAYDDAMGTMSDAIYDDYMRYTLSYSRLLEWAMKHDSFWDAFEPEISKAREIYFHDWYHKVEDEDESKPDFPDDVDESNYNPFMGCDDYECTPFDEGW